MLKRILFLLVSAAGYYSTSAFVTTTKTVTVTATALQCDATSVVPSTGSTDCLKLVNDFRKSKGVPILKSYPSKNQCTAQQALLDYKSGDFHTNFGMCREISQLSAKGSKTLKQCIDEYIAEGRGGSHYSVLVSKKYTHLSCGYYKYANNKYFYIQNFYKLASPSTTTTSTPTYTTPPPPVPTSNSCVDLINAFRSSLGLAKLKPATASQNQCADDSAVNDRMYGYHNSFSLRKCPGVRGQCQCNGQSTLKQCIDAYISEGPGGGHFEILRGAYTSVACGTDGNRFYTHNFY